MIVIINYFKAQGILICISRCLLMELTSDFYKLAEEKLYSEVIEGKNLRQSDLYSRFFSAARVNKEHADNLGEELIAICVHILSHMVGIKDGKLCVRTDDKGASGKIVVMGTTAFDLSVGDRGR